MFLITSVVSHLQSHFLCLCIIYLPVTSPISGSVGAHPRLSVRRGGGGAALSLVFLFLSIIVEQTVQQRICVRRTSILLMIAHTLCFTHSFSLFLSVVEEGKWEKYIRFPRRTLRSQSAIPAVTSRLLCGRIKGVSFRSGRETERISKSEAARDGERDSKGVRENVRL